MRKSAYTFAPKITTFHVQPHPNMYVWLKSIGFCLSRNVATDSEIGKKRFSDGLSFRQKRDITSRKGNRIIEQQQTFSFSRHQKPPLLLYTESSNNRDVGFAAIPQHKRGHYFCYMRPTEPLLHAYVTPYKSKREGPT